MMAWRLGWALRLGGLGLSAGLVLYGVGVVRPPDLETLIGSVGQTLGAYTYALVAVMAFLGRRLGRAFLLRHGPRVQITEQRLKQVEAFFARYSPATILIGRFVGLVRPIAPFLAGASKMPARRFTVLAVIGTGLWSAAFALLGFVFWQSFDQAVAIAKQGTLTLGGLVLLAAGLVWGYRYLRGRRSRKQPGPSPSGLRAKSSRGTDQPRPPARARRGLA